VALLTSAAVRHVSQPAFERTSDASYRAVPFDVDASELRIDHRSPIGSDARTDLEIVVPRRALAELAQQDIVGSIAPQFFSFVGGTEVQQQVEEQLAPALAGELQALGVDLAILVPYWPFCHETVGLVANGIESGGIPTLVIGTVRDIMQEARAPRSVLVDFPVGRTFGHPHDPGQHQQVLAAALEQLQAFTEPGQIRELSFQWSDGDRSWEDMVRTELQRPHV
jgi:hypothetical protein